MPNCRMMKILMPWFSPEIKWDKDYDYTFQRSKLLLPFDSHSSCSCLFGLPSLLLRIWEWKWRIRSWSWEMCKITVCPVLKNAEGENSGKVHIWVLLMAVYLTHPHLKTLNARSWLKIGLDHIVPGHTAFVYKLASGIKLVSY